MLQPAYKYYYKTELKTHNARLTKFLALFYGFVCLGVALLIRNYESLLQTCFIVFGICGGPLFALFTAGMMIPAVNQFVSISSIGEIEDDDKVLTNLLISGSQYRFCDRIGILFCDGLRRTEAETGSIIYHDSRLSQCCK